MATRGRKRAARGGGRGGGGGGGSVVSQRRTSDPDEGTQATTSSCRGKRPSSLPSQYDFVPRDRTQPPPPVVTNNQRPVGVRDYPPPTRLFQNSMSQPGETPPQTRPVTSPQARASPHSSQAQNSPMSQPQQEAPFEEEAPPEPSLSEDQINVLNSILSQPGRELYTTVLSPIEKPGTTWFGRDKSRLTRKITKVFTNKFDGPYYSWKCVPRDRQERYFVEFAKTHTWDPIFTGVVQQHFESICQTRMKDMEIELGRPVSVGEVFIRTHTKPDGTFIDLKAEKVVEAYQKNKEAKLAELEADIEEDSHATSHRQELTVEEDNEIFLQSTFVNDRGQVYGVGSLESVINGKRKNPESSSSFLGMQQQLEAAHRKIEEQAAATKQQQEESSRVAAAQQSKIDHLTLVEKYLTQTDPRFLEFIASQAASTTADPATSQEPAARET